MPLGSTKPFLFIADRSRVKKFKKKFEQRENDLCILMISITLSLKPCLVSIYKRAEANNNKKCES